MKKGASKKKDYSGEDLEYLLYPYRLHTEVGVKEEDRDKSEKRFFNDLKSLNEEALQLTEFRQEDKRLCNELCLLLRDSLRQLDISIEISAKALPFIQKAEKIILNTKGHLIIISKDKKIDSMTLEDYPPEVVLMVVWNIIPKLKLLIIEYTDKVKQRVEYFDRISRDLRSLKGAFDIPFEEEFPTNVQPEVTFFRTY